MSHRLLSEPFRSPVDVALVRARIGHLLRAGAQAPEVGAEFLSVTAERALDHVESGSSGQVWLELSSDHRALRATVVGDGPESEAWVRTLDLEHPLPDAVTGPEGSTRGPSEVELLAAQQLADDRHHLRMTRLARQRAEELASHQRELEETNQGVLALHAELAQASDEQQRLLRAERAARDEAETARSRLTFLSAASAQLMATLQRTEICGHLEKLLIPEYALAVDLWVVDEGDTLVGLGGSDAVDPPRTVVRSVNERRPVHGRPKDGVRSTAFPLLLSSRPLGAMLLHRITDVEDDSLMLGELARRVAAALENAQRFEHERDTAATLQRAMLTQLPRVPGLELTARYRPAEGGMNVGGDWYDVFPLEDGEYVGVVGDVTGHGIHAAVTMGQLRTALRAYAVDERSPAALLGLLHRLLDRLEPDLFATAVIIRFRQGSSEVTMASAGHPPPLLRKAPGEAAPIEMPSGGMLGLPVDLTHTDHRVEIPPGRALLLYTDGLVERRGESIDDGIARLAEGFGTAFRPGGDPERAADELLSSALRDHSYDDDVCMLLLSPTADTG
ncbi:PP2C family protein-serine/threonine phosphatase [Nocardiopsis metallicus]|uniref:Serine phosphatase RsbU (Regulator of sigma subunit) n=1 Tax=Nocardiopsis metallicus TaxID=179819 RepID=A0A840WMC5_9ACTN|nr:GAF domain-containing SpoIIE family protein phosphatase [Nocardiopsis metallicus]MBB5492797.1 serine phosphatase RsbU (regulator of sigma subunit) [Nocardiopsis metallicus]